MIMSWLAGLHKYEKGRGENFMKHLELNGKSIVCISGEERKWGHKTVNLWRVEGRLGRSPVELPTNHLK